MLPAFVGRRPVGRDGRSSAMPRRPSRRAGQRAGSAAGSAAGRSFRASRGRLIGRIRFVGDETVPHQLPALRSGRSLRMPGTEVEAVRFFATGERAEYGQGIPIVKGERGHRWFEAGNAGTRTECHCCQGYRRQRHYRAGSNVYVASPLKRLWIAIAAALRAQDVNPLPSTMS